MNGVLSVGSLFSGIGGLDLGLERAGMRVRWQCEADAFCRDVLRRHWPDVPCYGDVRDVGADAPTVDLVAGGFPCQPVSFAGSRKAQADERWLWPEFARVVGALRPRYVLVENVRGLCSKGLPEVLAGLAGLGYDAEWQLVSAASVGAPHLRERIFVVAYPARVGRQDESQIHDPRGALVGAVSGSNGRDSGGNPTARGFVHRGDQESQGSRDVADALSGGWLRWAGDESAAKGRHEPSDGRAGLAGQWAAEPDVGRVAHGVPRRVDRLRALGNAVVPQVAEFVGRLIVEAHERGEA